MNLRANRIFGGTRRRGESGFTMAEIAIALGVIAVALIAILGILPSGLQVQRDNREETIINQDSRLLLQAIKSGWRGIDSDLGTFVIGVDNDGVDYRQSNPRGIPTSRLIQLLSDPTNSHTIVFSAVSGGIASRGSEVGFRYQITSEVNSPLNPVRPLFDGAADFVLPPADVSLTNQLFDVRLRFSWPVVGEPPNVRLASEVNRYVARTLVSGWYATDGFIYAQEYRQPKP